jgi:V8-like Glu-specific endopeptidase
MRVVAGRRSAGERTRGERTRGERTRGERTRGRRARLLAFGLGAVGAAAALLVIASGTAGSTDRTRSVLAAGRGLAIDQAAPAATAAPERNGATFNGVAAVGALFTESNGKLGSHFCTASVVDSKAGDLAVTAAHCVYGRTGTLVFAPGYANGKAPYGVWTVAKVYTDSAWDAGEDPDHDVAFLRLSDAADGTSIENLTGAETLGSGISAGQTVQVIGYPDTAAAPVWCAGPAKGFSATQLEFDCGGYTVGTSGGPFLADVDPATGQGTVIGVIGGYQEGGDTPQVSYAAVFGTAVSQLYETAQAGS